MDAFLDSRRRDGCVDNTIENYEFRLYAILDLPANDLRPIRWVGNRGQELYDASLVRKNGKSRAGDTHINGLGVARMWGKFCVEKRMLKANPFVEVKRIGKRNKGSRKSRLTVNESRQLEAYCFAHEDNPDCVLTYGYLMLGKRASELVGIVARDLDDDGWLLHIRKAKTEASEGAIGLPADLRRMLLELAKGKPADAPLFVNYGGEPMSRHVANARVKAVCKAAGVPGLPPQALRRTFTDNAERQGFALRSIAEMTGHTNTAVTTTSYISPATVEAGRVERNLRLLQGGRR